MFFRNLRVQCLKEGGLVCSTSLLGVISACGYLQSIFNLKVG
jgi:hypothetical protein